MNRPPARSRLVFVNRFYWPDVQATAQLLADLAEGLAKRGFAVTVIASHNGLASTPVRETRNSVEIVRLTVTRWGGRTLAGKIADYLSFSASVRRQLRSDLHAGDRLVAMTDPPTLAPLAASAARRARGRLAHWIQDIHPEIGFALSGSRLLPALLSPWICRRDAAWREADVCVTIGRGMAELVAEHGVSAERLHVVPNWAPGGEALVPVPAAANALRREWGLDGKFVVAYSGNLGRVHALEPVLAAAAKLRDASDLEFLFIGDGPQRSLLEATTRAQGLSNVRFVPPQPRARLAESLSVGDVHLVTLRPGCERCVFPSKLYGILAVARPIVYVGPARCELAEAVRAHEAGLTLEPDSPQALAAALRALRGDSARCDGMAAAAARWSREIGGLRSALDAWERLLVE